MKVILYMAISIDGYIATESGDSEWIYEPDFDVFDEVCDTSDAIIVGNTTYQQYRGEIYPIRGKPNFIISNSENHNEGNSLFFSSPESAIKQCNKQGLEKIMLVGGGHINGAFLSAGLIDEIIVDIQPIILGNGIKLFEKINKKIELDFKEYQPLNQGLNILKYTVKK